MHTLRLLAASAPFLLSACAATSQAPAPAPPERPAASASLAGTAWQLAAIESMDDAQGTTRPAPGKRYTVRFAADGSAAFQLDCNRGSARWTAAPAAGSAGGTLQFGTVALTRAMCAPPALDTRIARDLESVRSYSLRDGTLSMSLMADGGIYRWMPLTQAAPAP